MSTDSDAVGDAISTIRDLKSKVDELEAKWFWEKSAIEANAIGSFLLEKDDDEIAAMDKGLSRDWKTPLPEPTEGHKWTDEEVKALFRAAGLNDPLPTPPDDAEELRKLDR